MALNADALITVTDARTYARIPSPEAPADAWWEEVINGISTQVQSATGRRYKPRTASVTRQFMHDGTQTLDIDDCTDVVAVRVTGTPNEADSWNTVATDNWIAEPVERTEKNTIRFTSAIPSTAENVGWGALALHLGNDPSQTWWPVQTAAEARQAMIVEVTAKWGWENVPANVKLAVELWIHFLLQRDVGQFSPELAAIAVAQFGIPQEVKEILNAEGAKRSSVVAV